MLATAEKVSKVKRKIAGGTMIGSGGRMATQLATTFTNPGLRRIELTPRDKFKEQIPYFVVGYKGWNQQETLQQKINESGEIIDGILQLDIACCISSSALESVRGSGPLCLLAFLRSIHEAASYLQSATADLLAYGR